MESSFTAQQMKTINLRALTILPDILFHLLSIHNKHMILGTVSTL